MPARKTELSLQPGAVGDGTETDSRDEAANDLDRQGVKSVEVAARILEALMARQVSVALKDLSREAGLPAAKLHRYLTSLIRTRLVRRDPQTRLYQLGNFAMELGAAAMHSSHAMIDATRKQLNLRDAVDETVSLSIWSAQGPIVVNVEESSRSVLMTVRPGTLLPICSTAAGLVFAAFLPDHLTATTVAQEMQTGQNENEPIVSTAIALEELKRTIKKDKFFVNKGHLLSGVVAIAAPLFDHSRRVIGVLSIVGRQSHFTPAREALAISHLLRIAGHSQDKCA